jgi:hypothetical protein
MKQKELISYRVVEGDTGKNAITSADTFSSDDFSPPGIELRGSDVRMLGQNFLFWRPKTMEIAYRQDQSKRAMVIFSRLDGEEYSRSEDVLGPALWPDEELENFARERKKDHQKEVTIDLDALMKQSSSENGSYLIPFLRQIYMIHPEKEKVMLEGAVAPFLFLLVLDWFASKSKTILYHNEPLL